MKMPQTLTTRPIFKEPTFDILFLSFFVYVCFSRWALRVSTLFSVFFFSRFQFLHIYTRVCIHIHISVSICLSYDKMIRCKTLCLHVFFELVLHDTFELSVTHGKHIPFDISKRKIKLEISTISTWCAHLIQIIYMIWFHNDIFFMAIFKYPHFNEIYGKNKKK